jgi:putative DNA primase/helicase
MTKNKNALQNESNKNKRFLISPLYQEKLTTSNRFVCYKEDKRPYNAITRYQTDITNKMNYTSFYNACNSVRKNHEFEGIGFVLGYDETNDLNYCGLDIDNCIDSNGVISEQAQELIDLLDTYTEISRSGKGIHCIFIAQKQGDICKNNKLNFCKCLELYDNGRYFALTGNIIRNKDIENRQEQCNAIYNQYFKPKEITPLIAPNNPIYNEKNKTYGADYLKYIFEKDAKFMSYYNRTIQITDESASDMAFISKLAYWLDNKPELIKKWFFDSPYYNNKDEKHKKKANRKDYIDRTINNAINYRSRGGTV